MAYARKPQKSYAGSKAAKTKPAPERIERVWSNYQNDIFNEIANGNRNIQVNAKPGSSKTTTAIESMWRLPESTRKNTLSLAFSKDIQLELESRVPSGVVSKTFHSLGLNVLTSKLGRVEVDTGNQKMHKIIVSLIGDDKDKDELHDAVFKTVSACKANLYETEDEISQCIDQYDLDVGSRQEQIDAVSKSLDLCAKQSKVVSYDDMLWLCYKLDLNFPKYANAYVDEAQDASKLRINLLMRCLGPRSRAVVFGDENQAIFQFAFADEHSMQNLQSALNPIVLPLSVSYRCAKNIVREAQKIVPSIEYADASPEGIVENVNSDRMMREAMPGDFILSRINAPLIGICLKFIKEGRRANIQGRDIGKTLGWMIRRSKKDTVSDFLDWLLKWQADEVERIIKKKGDPQSVIDRVECLQALCEDAGDLQIVYDRIDKLFADDGNGENGKIVISSAHRSKGKEKDRVWLLSKTFRPSDAIAEMNLRYVAITRAKSALYYVND